MKKFDVEVIQQSMRSISEKAREISSPQIAVIGDDTLKALQGLKGHKFVYGNWPKSTTNSVFTKEILNQSKAQFEQQHMCDFRDSLWDDIYNAARDIDEKGRFLSYFVVGCWASEELKQRSGTQHNTECNSLLGHRLRMDEHLPSDALWGMDSFHNILFKIKVRR